MNSESNPVDQDVILYAPHSMVKRTSRLSAAQTTQNFIYFCLILPMWKFNSF